jgi:hypothetical protein
MPQTFTSMGVQAARAKMKIRAVTSYIKDRKAPATLAYLGEQLANYSKDHGPWQDQTSNLRRSISWYVLAPGETAQVQYFTDTDGVQTVTVVNDTPGPMLVFFAGMRYGIFVEYKAGKWVLRGAVEHFRPVLTQLLGDRLKIRSASEILRRVS